MRFFNNKEWAQAKDLVRKLRKVHRSAFPREPVPLRVGIDKEIVEAGHFTESEVKLALAYYVAERSYLKACAKPGAMRHDLRGQPVAPVSEAEAAYARDPYGHRAATEAALMAKERSQ